MKKLILASLLACTTAHATILTFDGTSYNVEIPSTFGDNAAVAGTGFNVSNGATPNIDLTWSAAANGGTGTGKWEFYNDSEWSVAQLNDARTDGLAVFSVTFTPSAGFAVQLNSFTFDPWEDA